VNREYHRWFSPSLGRDMELLIFGHAGTGTLVFPTSMGRFYEYEDRGMVAALGPTIEAGNIRLFCVDSVDAESWYNREAHPGVRVARHLQYERYIRDEVVPLMRTLGAAAGGRFITTGCSLGAFHAAVLALRHPSLILKLIALSGKYENSTFLDGQSDQDAYLTNPLAFLHGLSDPEALNALRSMEIDIVTGSTDPHVHEARELSALLEEKAIPNTFDVWDGWVHDWPYWQDMIRKYL
jgi:esterase/lipase superfamily enzyme